MFYRIRDNKIYDYADYEYAKDCLYSDICTLKEFQNNTEIYTVIDGVLSFVPNYQEIIEKQRKQTFEKEFFETSLGWIRRQVTMKDGSKKDFLSDLLIPIKTGMEIGQDVKIITYKTPDFCIEPNNAYFESLQEIKSVNADFIKECLYQTVEDFGGVNIDDNDTIENISDTDENIEMSSYEDEILTGGSDGV